MRNVREEDILFVQWKDRRTVTLLSTVHNGNDSVNIDRNTRVGGEHVVLHLRQPSCIKDYNAHMGGVDLFDQRIAAHRCLRKVMKYYKTIVVDVVDAVVVNCNILFKHHQAANPELIKRPKSYDSADFRAALACQLAGIDEDDAVVPVYRPEGKKRSNALQLPPGPHVVRFTNEERSCKRCSRVERVQRKCQTMCVTCGLYLHANHRNCFYLYHQQ